MFRWLIPCLIVSAFCGCVSTPSTQQKSFGRRGVPVLLDETPAAVRDAFRQQHSEVSSPQVERCDDGEMYRFELPSGEVLFLNAKGEWQGGVI